MNPVTKLQLDIASKHSEKDAQRIMRAAKGRTHTCALANNQEAAKWNSTTITIAWFRVGAEEPNLEVTIEACQLALRANVG